METKRININDLALNTGQVEGLPANPRQWTREDIDKIAASLVETPELFEMRPCIVTPHEGKYVILAGSLRFCGARQNGDADVPCIVFEGPPDKMREIVIKDNGSWGAWDFDALANEWDSDPLTEWGVPAWAIADTGGGDDDEWQPSVPDEEREDADYDNAKMIFQFKAEEFGFVSDALALIDANKENALLKLLHYGEDSETA